MDQIKIRLENIGKRFGRQWIFQNVSALMEQGKTYALTGNNGSGKSTLLQMIYGYQSSVKGKIMVTAGNDQVIEPEELFRHVSFTAPYIDLPEELTLEEQLRFHFTFKNVSGSITFNDIMGNIWLDENRNKKLKYFSSGMKQRVKLAQAFFADTPVILLDEPCTNLDAKGIEWYREMINRIRDKKLLIIASNQEYEYDFADEVIRVGK